MLRMGTSGFSYNDWIGPVYPPDLSKVDWLPFYAQEFNTVELNVTYYRIPTIKTAAGWVERTPEDFLFAVKAYKGITHERKQPDYDAFTQALAPLIEANKMGCILAQFPYSFRPSDENRRYLRQMRKGFGELPVVVEFRNKGWGHPEAFKDLRRLNMGFCCVDEPQISGLMPPVTEVTGSLAYVRFHGRNAAKWWQHDHAWERYDYSYSQQELWEWVPRIMELDSYAPLTLVYANNHYKGQSVQTMRALKTMLASQA